MSADARAWEALVRHARLAAAAPTADAPDLGAAVRAVAGRVIPARAHRDQCAFEALRAVGRAFANSGAGRRSRLASALACLAEECSRVLGWEPPASHERAPHRWRERADCGEGA